MPSDKSNSTAALTDFRFPGEALSLAPIHEAQARVHKALFKAGATDSVLRLAKCDLLETLLLKASLFIKDEPSYSGLETAHQKDVFLSLHLCMATLSWLADRCVALTDQHSVRIARALLLDAPLHP